MLPTHPETPRVWDMNSIIIFLLSCKNMHIFVSPSMKFATGYIFVHDNLLLLLPVVLYIYCGVDILRIRSVV